MVNKRDKSMVLNLPSARGSVEQWVDQHTAEQPPARRTLAHNRLHLGGLGVAVITLAGKR
jgi:hypothetical protein